MQTQNLLPQISSASPAPARQNGPAKPETNGAQFSQALSREITQRQNASPAPQAAKPATQPKQADKAAASKADAGRSAQAEPARQPAKADSNDKPASTAAAAAKSAASADKAAEAAARASELPVTDMLALVASFNQLQPIPKETAVAVAAPAAGEAEAPAGADGGVALPVDLAGQFAQGALQALGEQALGERTQGEQPAADTAPVAARAAAADAAAPLTQAIAAAADTVAEPSRFAGMLAQERAEPALLKDVQAAAAPLAGPVQQASLNIAQAAAGVNTDRIAARVGTPGWDNQVGQKIIWMVAGQEQSATLTLNPPEMGPMQVVLSVTNDQATVTFSASQLEVRQALENAMPKLREMMSESGIALGNATVDAGTQDQRQAQGEAGRANAGRGFGAGGNPLEVAEQQPGRPMNRGGTQGMVDIFA